MSDDAKIFLASLMAHVKSIYESPELGDGERIPMIARGDYQPNAQYRRGDVVSVKSVGLFQAVNDTVQDPRVSKTDWLTIYLSTGISSGQAPSMFPPVWDVATATSGQTIFSMTQMPVYPSTVMVYVNGVAYPQPNFGIGPAPNQVTWTNSLFSLSAGDELAINYF